MELLKLWLFPNRQINRQTDKQTNAEKDMQIDFNKLIYSKPVKMIVIFKVATKVSAKTTTTTTTKKNIVATNNDCFQTSLLQESILIYNFIIIY